MIGEDGGTVKEPETLRSYLVASLNNKAASEHEPVPAEEAAKRYQLSVKLYAKNEVDLTLAEAGLLQERVGSSTGTCRSSWGGSGMCWRETSPKFQRWLPTSPVPANSDDDLARRFMALDAANERAAGRLVRPTLELFPVK